MDVERVLAAAFGPEPWAPPAKGHRVAVPALAGAEGHRVAAGPLPREIEKRPPSWAAVADAPHALVRCSCCKGAAFWREAIAPSGWCCGSCHPPVHLAPAAIAWSVG